MRIFVFISLFAFFSIHATAQVTTIRNPREITLTLIGKSEPVRTLKKDKQGLFRRTVENESLEAVNKPQFKQEQKPDHDDAALQRTTDTSGSVIEVLSNWEGLSTGVDPSDNTLAVSANYVVQLTNNWSNSIMNVWDKQGNLLVEEVNTGDLSGFSDFGDPNIVYDRQADRFIFCCLDGSLGNKLVICISETGDPTGSWFGYKLNFNEGFPDYPKIAVWGNSYMLTTNSTSPSIWAINRDKLLAGEATSDVQEFNLDRFGSIGFQSASPVTQTGATAPPPGAPAPVIRVGDDAWVGETIDHLELYFVSINWDDASLSEITGPYNLTTIEYDSKLCGFDNWQCIPQPGTSQKLDPLSDIVMDKVQYLNFTDHETIICSHVCRAYTAGYAGIRWYELRKNSGETDYSIYQQGTFAPNDSNYRFMPSITMNEEGVIALGYNISSSSVYPSIGLTGKTECDSSGIMGASEIVAQEGSKANSGNRYGDYNNMVSDPADGSFWLTSNYNQTSSWKTRVIHFSVAPCKISPPDSSVSIFGNLTIMPVPADNLLMISFSSISDEDLDIELYDMLGQIVKRQPAEIIKGQNYFELDTKILATGSYILRLQAGKEDTVKQIIVQHE